MRKIIISSLLLLAFIYRGHCQVNMGNIEVNKDFTATLNFGSDVKFITLGNNPQIGVTPDGNPLNKYYVIFQEGSTVVIKGIDPLSPKTSITVKLTSGSIYYGTLAYGLNTQIFYDFQKIESKQKMEEVHKDSVNEAIGEKSLVTRLNYVLGLENEYVEGIDENLLEVVISVIRNDDKYTYFKISIRNNSGNDYIIDNTTFKYVEGKNKGLFKKGNKIEERVNTIYETNNKTVKAYSISELGYVIPLYAVGTSGNLKIQFKELKGTRNPAVEINSKTMLKVKTLGLMEK